MQTTKIFVVLLAACSLQLAANTATAQGYLATGIGTTKSNPLAEIYTGFQFPPLGDGGSFLIEANLSTHLDSRHPAWASLQAGYRLPVGAWGIALTAGAAYSKIGAIAQYSKVPTDGWYPAAQLRAEYKFFYASAGYKAKYAFVSAGVKIYLHNPNNY